MTRKDFIIVAEIIAMFNVSELTEIEKQKINTKLRCTNEYFNSVRFWDYVEKMKNN